MCRSTASSNHTTERPRVGVPIHSRDYIQDGTDPTSSKTRLDFLFSLYLCILSSRCVSRRRLVRTPFFFSLRIIIFVINCEYINKWYSVRGKTCELYIIEGNLAYVIGFVRANNSDYCARTHIFREVTNVPKSGRHRRDVYPGTNLYNLYRFVSCKL